MPGGPSGPREALDEVAGEVPVALLAHDSHSLWLNSAALARANGDLEVEGGVVERDAAGVPTGILREEACWIFRDRHVEIAEAEYLEAMREGLRVAAARGVTRSTTRTAGSEHCGSGRRSPPRVRCPCASGSRFPPTMSSGWPSWACGVASATGCSGSAT